MSYYKIAGICISTDKETDYISDKMKFFLTRQLDPDIRFHVEFKDEIIRPLLGEIVEKDELVWENKLDGQGYLIYKLYRDTDEIICKMEADKGWKDIFIEIIDKPFDMRGPIAENALFLFLGIAFRNHIINTNGIVIHASAIKYKEQGIMFTAPSGTGKSTQAELWMSLFRDETEIINDDTPAIIVRNNEIYVCGTPWGGSKEKFRNTVVPLKSLIVIEQAMKNEIVKVESGQALQKIIPRFFIPYYNEEMTQKAFSNIIEILDKVKIYLLKCTPDKEAAHLTHKVIINNADLG